MGSDAQKEQQAALNDGIGSLCCAYKVWAGLRGSRTELEALN